MSVAKIRKAHENIGPYIRHTPLIHATKFRSPPAIPCDLYLKLDNFQVNGSFKVRGALNKILSLSPEEYKNGLLTATGGNHGRAVAYVGWLKNIPVTIVTPHSTSDAKVQMMREYGAEVLIFGKDMGEAMPEGLRLAKEQQKAYIPPFSDQEVINGAGTLGLEVLADQPDLDAIVVAIGGGGMISGIALAAKEINPNIRIYGVEPTGCPTIYNSLKAGSITPVTDIKTTLGPLAIRETAEINFNIIQEHVDDVVLIDDDEFQKTARWLWKEYAIGAELSGVASLSAIHSGKLPISPTDKVCAIICGLGNDGIC